MAEINISQENWAAGELSPLMEARSNLPIYSAGAKKLLNFISETSGPSRYRNGTQFVNPTRRNAVACFIPFQFNSTQAYELEFTAGWIRFYQNDTILTLAGKNITGASKAAPVVITAVAHGYSNGDEVIVSGVSGMTELNNRNFVVANKTDDTFELYDTTGTVPTDGSAYTAYVSGGVSSKIYEIANPYAAADLFALKFAQNADTMYLVHRLYAPQKLVRSGATSWVVGTFSRTSDPFTGAGSYPGGVAFYGGRLYYAGTVNAPESFWGSKPLDASGNPQYDDLTIGAGATDAFKITLSPITGKVDVIFALVPCINFLAICTLEGITKLTDGNGGTAIYAGAVDATPTVTLGVLQQVTPILLGISMVYIHRSALTMYSLEFDIFYNAYNAIDKNISNEHITASGVKQMLYCYGRPSMFLQVRNDGMLVGVTYQVKETINGAHRHLFGGVNAKVLSVGVMPRENAYDQIWLVVERTVNGHTVRYVEFINDRVIFPVKEDYYTGPGNEATDDARWRNAVFELQKQYVFSDANLTYDGSDYATVTLTPGAVTGNGVTFTAGGAVFTAAMVGRQLWKKSVDGVGTGRAIITAYVSATQVTCNILSDFDAVTTMPVSGWYLTTAVVGGAWHLEGETVKVVTDGGQHADRTVASGKITLQYQSSVVQLGLGYIGMVQSMPVEKDMGGMSSEGMSKNINRMAVHFLDTLGAKYGTNLYALQEVEFRSNVDKTGRPSPPYSGLRRLQVQDTNELHKHVYIVQDRPLPCIVLGIAPFMDVDQE